MHRLEGRRILVTGASSGIGEAIARACAAAGARVACLARRGERLRTVAEEIGGEAVVAEVGNIGSLSNRRVPSGGGGVYSASKFAVHALSTALRREPRSSRIRMTLGAPPGVDTVEIALVSGAQEI